MGVKGLKSYIMPHIMELNNKASCLCFSVGKGRNTGNNTATLVGASVAGTFMVCLVVAAIALTCLAKHWRKKTDGAHKARLGGDAERTVNGSAVSTKTTTTDVGSYRLTTDDSIGMKSLAWAEETATGEDETDGKSARNSSSEAAAKGKMNRISKVSPMLMKPWAGPPRAWGEESGGKPATLRNLYTRGFWTQPVTLWDDGFHGDERRMWPHERVPEVFPVRFAGVQFRSYNKTFWSECFGSPKCTEECMTPRSFGLERCGSGMGEITTDGPVLQSPINLIPN